MVKQMFSISNGFLFEFSILNLVAFNNYQRIIALFVFLLIQI